MLNVHRYSSTFTPGVCVGTRNAVIPFACPASPLVRAKTTQWVATCMPVVHIFSPSMRQPAPPAPHVPPAPPHLPAAHAPAVAAARLGLRARLHVSRVGAVLRLGQS